MSVRFIIPSRLLLLLLSMATVLAVWAAEPETDFRVWTADELPIPYLQDARRHVSNPETILGSTAETEINQLLQQLEEEKGVQSLVCVVHRVAEGDCYEFGMALARKYGIGSKKQNSGLIVVLSIDDRSYYILTGTGLEGTLPDAICKRIEYTYMVPYFKEQEWDTGMLKAIQAIHGYIQGDPELCAQLADDADGDAVVLLLVLIAVIAIAFFVIVYLNAHGICRSCGKRRVRAVSKTLLYTRGDWDYYRIVYQCEHCGNREVKTERHPRSNDSHHDNTFGNLGSGFFIGGSGFGGGGGGGGFSGGSFGGGSFGGGGAGGRF